MSASPVTKTEKLVRLAQLPSLHPALADVNPHTVCRWGLKGTKLADGRTVKLEMTRVGSVWKASVEAVDRYIAAINAPTGESPTPAPRTPTQRRRASEEAAAELDARGF